MTNKDDYSILFYKIENNEVILIQGEHKIHTPAMITYTVEPQMIHTPGKFINIFLLTRSNINVLEWPSQSPDLILLTELKIRVMAERPSNLKDLRLITKDK
ncbi:hypothetical protein XENOCAPTIV_013530 [Xenoophorus captivus]|uniref:Uncharacterized protein n=1 Tax=Xenoophorus captivus TaxID=1517983 RepID=A0ABV0RHD6_9TELE